jgi:hypothetical protein
VHEVNGDGYTVDWSVATGVNRSPPAFPGRRARGLNPSPGTLWAWKPAWSTWTARSL